MSLTETWLQDVAESSNIPAVAPSVSRKALPVIEMQLKKIIQLAAKFQKHGKGRTLTVEDINLALSLNGLEEIYGLCPPSESVSKLGTSTSGAMGSSSASSSSSSSSSTAIINLLDFAKQPIPRCPLIPELTLHWLAVEGCQPLIQENPLPVADKGKRDVAGSNAVDLPLSLPKEMQHFFSRTTGLMLASDGAALPAVLHALRSDVGIQDLVPYYSRFIYQQVKANTKSLPMLKVLVSAAAALIANNSLHMEFHVQQLLPAIFTCIVAARLSSSPSENHWAVRSLAADVIAQSCRKYSEVCPDLHARVCKTYLDTVTAALTTLIDGNKEQAGTQAQRSAALSTLYGGLVGLSALGQAVIKALVLPRVAVVNVALEGALADAKKYRVQQQSALAHREEIYAVEKCRSALLHALGTYMVERSRFGELSVDTAPAGAAVTNGKRGRQGAASGAVVSVGGLEEALIPYYTSFSRDLYHARLFL
jgi:transcription initiation factor TFIID subunit 6